MNGTENKRKKSYESSADDRSIVGVDSTQQKFPADAIEWCSVPKRFEIDQNNLINESPTIAFRTVVTMAIGRGDDEAPFVLRIVSFLFSRTNFLNFHLGFGFDLVRDKEQKFAKPQTCSWAIRNSR